MFNKKLEQRIERLEKQFITICGELTAKKDEFKKPKCFESGDCIPEQTYLYRFGQKLRAIIDYLNIVIKEEFEDDDSFPKPQIPKRKVWRAYKKNGK